MKVKRIKMCLRNNHTQSKQSDRNMSNWPRLRKTKLRLCLITFLGVVAALLILAKLGIHLSLPYSEIDPPPVSKSTVPRLKPGFEYKFSLPKWDRVGPLKRCKPPSPDPFHEDVLHLVRNSTEVRCERETNLTQDKDFHDDVAFAVKNGRYLHRLVNLGVPCCTRLIKRKDDEHITVSQQCLEIKEKVTAFGENVEYIAVECKKGKKIIYRDAFALVHKKKAFRSSRRRISRMRGNKSVKKLNVIVLGMESVSQLNFLRSMPLSHEFLVQDLSGILLQGFNKVAESTNPNVIPLLTGQSMKRFKDTCIDPQTTSRKILNHCGLIWNDFARNGYLTAYANEDVSWSLFNLYWHNSFEAPPTHYYFRPIGRYQHDHLDKLYDTDFCIGPRLSFKVILSFMEQIIQVNEGKQPYFQFLFPSYISYWYLNDLQHADKLLLSSLKRLKKRGVFSNTIFIIFGDHGFRKRDFKLSHFGGIEDKMPIGMVVVPEWFKNSYPQQYSNLLGNAEKMTSAFDIHKTLKDILDLGRAGEFQTSKEVPNNFKEPGTSLFGKIPGDRTCLGAGIPLIYCLPCHPKLNISDTFLAVEAGYAATQILNKHVRSFNNSRCEPNVKGYVTKALKWDPRDVRRELQSKVILPGFMSQPYLVLQLPWDSFLESGGTIDVVEIELAVSIGDAAFYAVLIRYGLQDKIWHMTEGMERRDSYSGTGFCARRYSEMTFCLCNEEKKE